MTCPGLELLNIGFEALKNYYSEAPKGEAPKREEPEIIYLSRDKANKLALENFNKKAEEIAAAREKQNR